MRLFEEYGTPSTAGDITYIDYLVSLARAYTGLGFPDSKTVSFMRTLTGGSDGKQGGSMCTLKFEKRENKLADITGYWRIL